MADKETENLIFNFSKYFSTWNLNGIFKAIATILLNLHNRISAIEDATLLTEEEENELDKIKSNSN